MKIFILFAILVFFNFQAKAQECSNSYDCPILIGDIYLPTEGSMSMDNKQNCILQWSYLHPTPYCLKKSCVYLIPAGARTDTNCQQSIDKKAPISCGHILIERNLLTTTGGYTKTCMSQRYLQAIKTDQVDHNCYYPSQLPSLAGESQPYTASENCDDAIPGP